MSTKDVLSWDLTTVRQNLCVGLGILGASSLVVWGVLSSKIVAVICFSIVVLFFVYLFGAFTRKIFSREDK